MVAVTGWVTGLWGSDRLRPKVVVMDEFWRLLTDRATAEWAKYLTLARVRNLPLVT